MTTTEAATFRNQLNGLSIKFVEDFKRRDAGACAEPYCTRLKSALPLPAGWSARERYPHRRLAHEDDGIGMKETARSAARC
jgi:hypothetical protein